MDVLTIGYLKGYIADTLNGQGALQGKNGITPSISNGYWFLDAQNTGSRATPVIDNTFMNTSANAASGAAIYNYFNSLIDSAWEADY